MAYRSSPPGRTCPCTTTAGRSQREAEAIQVEDVGTGEELAELRSRLDTAAAEEDPARQNRAQARSSEGLAQVPQSELQIATTYKNRFQTQQFLRGSVHDGELIQAELAAQLIGKLSDNVAPSEANEVANAFADIGDYKQAVKYYKVAIAIARARRYRLVLADAYRREAGARYGLHQLKGAHYAIAQAFKAVHKGFPKFEIDQNKAATDLYDVPRAANADECKRASSKMVDAQKWVNDLSPSSSSYRQDSKDLVSATHEVHGCQPSQ